MITKNVTIEYVGSLGTDDTTDANFIAFDWEMVDNARTGNVIARAAFRLGNDTEVVKRTVAAAQLANAKVIDVFNALRADLAAQLGI